QGSLSLPKGWRLGSLSPSKGRPLGSLSPSKGRPLGSLSPSKGLFGGLSGNRTAPFPDVRAEERVHSLGAVVRPHSLSILRETALFTTGAHLDAPVLRLLTRCTPQ